MSSNASVPKTLRPASVDQFNVELLACLTLCAPSGMGEDQRVEWLKVARITLGNLPSDLLIAGCAEARKHADHPAKIVPTILRAVEPLLRSRRDSLTKPIGPEGQIEAKYVTPEAARAILEKHGLPIPEALKGRAA